MEPFADLFESRAAALDAIEAGGRQIEEFRSPYVGPVDTGRMVFPALEVLPESSDDQGGNVWTHVIRLNCYFERQRDVDYRTQLDAAGRAAVAAVGELASLPRAGAFRIQTVEDFAGSVSGMQLIVISVQFAIDVQLDLPSN